MMGIRMALMILCAYLAGSLPTSYIIVRMLKKTDIRAHGSGNLGATNVYRLAGRWPAVFTLVVDILKGTFSAAMLPAIFGAGAAERPEFWRAAAALAAVCGHNWTVFLKFRGGKGVATTLGAYLGLYPPVFAASFLVNVVLLKVFRIMSLASIGGAIAAPLYLGIAGAAGAKIPAEYHAAALIFAAMIILTHRENIGRLVKGKEKRLF